MITKEEVLKIANTVGLHLGYTEYKTQFEAFAEIVFEKGRQQGMKQEHALWQLAKTSQEIGDGL